MMVMVLEKNRGRVRVAEPSSNTACQINKLKKRVARLVERMLRDEAQVRQKQDELQAMARETQKALAKLQTVKKAP
jgi:hypothetical protein